MIRFSRSQAVIAILVALVLLAFYGWQELTAFHRQRHAPPPVPVPIVIQVTGRVLSPATYDFPHPVSVAEAVARAGGVLPGVEADPAWETLIAGPGARIEVGADTGGRATVSVGQMAASTLLALGMPADLNRVSAADLALIPGVSRSLGERIVAERARRGRYRSLEELNEVKGVGPATLERLSRHLVVGPAR
ncbi:MAG TPA: helix-hairpin-helix domain-containing protein [Syntrophobacteria bacterium]|nr:helix-hairpin-helix domain-containing protein [Syntrophobacteria bacterium]